jgi:hypothetical protein
MKGKVMDPESNGVKATKFATKIVVGFGAGKIAGDIIRSNTRVPVTKIDKITITAAAFVIGMMASEAVEHYATKQIDDFIKQYNNIRNPKSEGNPAS